MRRGKEGLVAAMVVTFTKVSLLVLAQETVGEGPLVPPLVSGSSSVEA